MPNSLTYSIFEGVLTGTLGTKFFSFSALSGGGGGSTKAKPADSVNSPYMEGLRTKGAATGVGHIHGGPIPPGRYRIMPPSRHPHLGLSAKLVHPMFKPMGRDGFFIHGRGPHGSDGCIVPLEGTDFQSLMRALTESKGGTLFVEETCDGSRFA